MRSTERTVHQEVDGPAVSVIIPCRDVVLVVEHQLAALANQDFAGRTEVLLADNGSRDGLADQVERWAREYDLALRCVDASGAPGVSHARNKGLESAHGEVVAVCDADDVVGPGWVTAMVAGLDEYDVVGGVHDVAHLNDRVRRTWRRGPPADRLAEKLGFLPYAVGANCAVRRAAALDVGGWDEDYLAGGDDVDFSWRLQLAGYRLGLAPGALVHYRFRTDLRGTARQAREYARCEARLLRQYAPAGAQRYRPSRTGGDLRWLVRRSPDLLRGEARRGRWVCRAATVAGRLLGAAQQRCWVG